MREFEGRLNNVWLAVFGEDSVKCRAEEVAEGRSSH